MIQGCFYIFPPASLYHTIYRYSSPSIRNARFLKRQAYTHQVSQAWRLYPWSGQRANMIVKVYQHVEKLHEHIIRAIGSASDVWRHFSMFVWWHTNDFKPKLQEAYIKNFNFSSFFFHGFLKYFRCNVISHKFDKYLTVDYFIS